MIYGRFGDKVKIVRVASQEDVRRLEGRKLDKRDRLAITNGSYVIITHEDDGPEGDETLYHKAYLRADAGLNEIDAAIAALSAPPGNVDAAV